MNRLSDGIHTNDDILNLKERIFDENSELNSLIDIPHLLKKDRKVNDLNEKVHLKQQQVKSKVLNHTTV